MHSVESALVRLLFVLRVSPRPIEPQVRVSLRQARDRMPVAKQQLKSRIPEIVICAEKHEQRRAQSPLQRTFLHRRKDYPSQRQWLPQLAQPQQSAKRQILEAGQRY